jgi:(p)ppGpp synthase/HD superfamily hydrolase
MISAKTFEKAITFATKAHQGQCRRGDGRPYILHPLSVMTRVLAIKKSANAYLLGAAAILHDVVEDCYKEDIKGGLAVIAKEFGYAVAAIVEELTLDKEMYEVIGKKEYLAQEMVEMSSYALAIKLCDRLDNVSDMESMTVEFQKSYLAETEYILKAIEARHLTKTHLKLIKMINKALYPYKIKINTGYITRRPSGRRRPLGGHGQGQEIPA